jgi:hypothetical protein
MSAQGTKEARRERARKNANAASDRYWREDGANRAAKLHPQTTPDGKPAIEVGGVLVFAYLKDGLLRVSVDLDTVDPKWMTGPEGEGRVPMRICVQGATVFEDDGSDRCQDCQVPEHDTCPGVTGCSCCTDTYGRDDLRLLAKYADPTG